MPGNAALSETDSLRFTAQVLDQEDDPISGATIIWQSSYPDLVRIDSTGRATVTSSFLQLADPLSPITITASAGTLSGTATIGLTRKGSFDAWPDTNLVYPGMTRAISTRMIMKMSWLGGGYATPPEVIPASSVQWSSSDDGIVTVNAAGTMTPVGPGHARIIAKHLGRLDTVEVYVTPPPATPLRFTSVRSDAPMVGTNGPGFMYAERACGASVDGSIYCWGAIMVSLQVSDRCEMIGPGGASGARIFRYRCSEIPLRVPTDVKFTAVVTRSPGATNFGASACGLATTKRVYCWGTNRFGELGLGTTDNLTHGVAPIAGTDEFTEIGGGFPFCGIRTDGVLRCWGGSLGASPVTIPSSKTLRTLAEAGGCALATDSTAFCVISGAAQSVGGTTRWKSIATAAFSDPCAIALDDSVYCGSSLQTRQTLPESLVRLGYYVGGFQFDGGLGGHAICGVTSSGDLRCGDTWTLVNLSVKVRSFYTRCFIATDDKAYCRMANNPTLVVVPGQGP